MNWLRELVCAHMSKMLMVERATSVLQLSGSRSSLSISAVSNESKEHWTVQHPEGPVITLPPHCCIILAFFFSFLIHLLFHWSFPLFIIWSYLSLPIPLHFSSYGTVHLNQFCNIFLWLCENVWDKKHQSLMIQQYFSGLREMQKCCHIKKLPVNNSNCGVNIHAKWLSPLGYF